MMLRNSEQQYGLVARFIHWTTALIVLGLLFVGFYMTSLEASPTKIQMFLMHKSFGTIVLALVVLRIVWKIFSRPPRSLDTHKKWEKGLAHAAHAFLYIALLAMPLSGWIMSSAGDFPYTFFDLFNMPHLVGKDEGIFNASVLVHGSIATILLGVVGLHLAGAAKHHVIDKDATLARMSGTRSLFSGLLVIAFFGGLWLAAAGGYAWHEINEEEEHEGAVVEAVVPAVAGDIQISVPQDEGGFAPADVTRWALVPENSSLAFEATQYGQVFHGSFRRFDARIAFDPEKLDQSRVQVQIDISSVRTGSADRDAQALTSDWFDRSAYPVAVYEAHSFEQISGGEYIAHGTLTIKDVTMNVDVPFELVFEEDGALAKMSGALSLDRLAFGVGQGEWADGKAIGSSVDVQITVEARSL